MPRQQRSRHLVEAILDATARILERQGYDKLNTNSVAVVAGVSIGSLYQYFPNKEALVAALLERHGQRLHETIANSFGTTPPATLEEAVGRIVASVVAAHRIDPKLHGVLEGQMPKVQKFDGHRATKDAIALLLRRLPPPILATIPEPEIAAHMVGEIVHALIHSALLPQPHGHTRGVHHSHDLESGIAARHDHHGDHPIDAERIERETARAVMGYLTYSARAG